MSARSEPKPSKKMELNWSFLTGIVCGVCVTLFIGKRRLLRLRKTSTAEATAKSEVPTVFDDGGEYKMVLVVRNDLKMGKGKIAAQCAHAAVGAYGKSLRKNPEALNEWEYTGQAKVALKVESERDLMEIYSSAKRAGLITSMIRDAGRTQISPNTKTVVGIGPACKSAIDAVTGHLKLM